jgi:hypothetical protein
MWIFKKKELPLPIYKRKPIATAAIILTVVGMFILGPIGVIYQGMTEELKKKANNETVILYMQQQKEKDDQQWKAIERIIEAPRNLTIKNEASKDNVEVQKQVLTPEQFEKYLSLKPEVRVEYKKYLQQRGFDTSGLPN